MDFDENILFCIFTFIFANLFLAKDFSPFYRDSCAGILDNDDF